MQDDVSRVAIGSKFAPQQRRSREARARILSAAERLLRDHGVENFSMMAVAQASDMPVGNIYRRFAGKEDLLLALKSLVSTRMTASIGDAVAGSHRSLEDYVRSFSSAVGKAFAYDEHLNRALYDLRLVDPEMVERGRSARRSIFEIFSNGLEPFLLDLPEPTRRSAATVAFSIISNAAALKVRDNDAILASVPWDDLASEFGRAAFLYLKSIR